MSEELTALTSLLPDMSSVHLTCAVKHLPLAAHYTTSALQTSAGKITFGFIQFLLCRDCDMLAKSAFYALFYYIYCIRTCRLAVGVFHYQSFQKS